LLHNTFSRLELAPEPLFQGEQTLPCDRGSDAGRARCARSFPAAPWPTSTDPLTGPSALMQAHHALDRAMDAAYIAAKKTPAA
jgi:hypothetical protein